MICFYHDDQDGRAAAAVVRRFSGSEDIKCIPMRYADPVPHHQVALGEKVFIVDFSFQKDDDRIALMKRTKDIIWIDHHKTSYDRAIGTPWEKLDGIRASDGDAGCVLAYRFFEKTLEVPRALALISDRDTWTWKHGDESAFFHAGLEMWEHAPEARIWDELIGWTDSSMVSTVLEMGRTIVGYRTKYFENYRKIAFETELAGYKVLAMNLAFCGSEGFGGPGSLTGALREGYDILCPFYWDGKQWTISLYSASVDVSLIAKDNGGGGHKGAAGYQTDQLQAFLCPTGDIVRPS